MTCAVLHSSACLTLIIFIFFDLISTFVCVLFSTANGDGVSIDTLIVIP